MKKKIFILFLSLCTTNLQAQEIPEDPEERYFSGLLLNDSAYARIPQKPVLLTRSYEVLPKRHSLRKYCPDTKNQGKYGTCTSWAAAYAARTITEAINNDWQDPAISTREAFSPLFVYHLVRGANATNCQTGIYLDAALETLKKRGAAKYRDFSYDCSSSITIPNNLYSKAVFHAIDNYFALFPLMSSSEDLFIKKINATKKSIAENRPVVISMANFASFQKNNEEIWSGITDAQYGYHAMCVVGYDDEKGGGAFLLMNSWGPRWGDSGFKWVKYTDFSKHVNYAMEMYVRKPSAKLSTSQPVPTPATTPKSSTTTIASKSAQLEPVDLAGEISFVLSTGQKMRPRLRNVNNVSYYVLEDSFVSGTRYRLYVSNHEPAYVYIIGSDLKNSVTKVFPPNDQISPALVYKSNEIAIPDENWYIQMDNTKGKDYACVLYSRDELPIDDIIYQIKETPGSFFEKVNRVLADKIVPDKAIVYDLSTIKFNVKNTNKTVVPVIVEIDHR